MIALASQPETFCGLSRNRTPPAPGNNKTFWDRSQYIEGSLRKNLRFCTDCESAKK